jgi:hypothetical protein
MNDIKAWLERHQAQVLPQSLPGTAIGYALGQWDRRVVGSVSDVIALTASRRSCGLAPILACQNISMNNPNGNGKNDSRYAPERRLRTRTVDDGDAYKRLTPL